MMTSIRHSSQSEHSESATGDRTEGTDFVENELESIQMRTNPTTPRRKKNVSWPDEGDEGGDLETDLAATSGSNRHFNITENEDESRGLENQPAPTSSRNSTNNGIRDRSHNRDLQNHQLGTGRKPRQINAGENVEHSRDLRNNPSRTNSSNRHINSGEIEDRANNPAPNMSLTGSRTRRTDFLTSEDQNKDLERNAPGPGFITNLDNIVIADRLARKLTARQVQMIAIGGTIGTAFFLGTSKSLETGGPATLLVGYFAVGCIMSLTMLSLAEMSAYTPIAGSFCTFAGRYVDRSLGFALTWNYFFNGVVSTGANLVTLQLVFAFWNTTMPGFALGLVFWVFMILANIITVAVYGEIEYWLSILKLTTLIYFFIAGIMINCGINKSRTYLGVQTWHVEEAPFVNGLGGFAAVFANASSAYGGIETVTIAAGETKNPKVNIPRVVKNVFWRILFFYVSMVLLIGLSVPYNHKELSSSYPELSSKSVTTSPFTIMLQIGGAKAAIPFINALLLSSAMSSGNHALYVSSRLLYSLSIDGYGPGVFKQLNRNKIPWVSVLSASIASGLCYGVSFISAGQVLTWLQHVVGVSNQIAWVAIAVTSIRFRRGMAIQDRMDALPFVNWTYPWGPWLSLVLNAVVLLVQGWSSFSPAFKLVEFVGFYVQLPIMLIMFVFWKLWKRMELVRYVEMDLVSDVDVVSGEDVETAAFERTPIGRFEQFNRWIF